MDKITTLVRSRNMSAIKSKNTKPELTLRTLLFSKGFRYRIHYPLPGKPDIVFTKKRISIFINGCFWHDHGCSESHIPKTNASFWDSKIKKNRVRDELNITSLKDLRWKVFTVWECEIEKDLKNVSRKLLDSLQSN